MRISTIVAVAENGVIGRNNDLVWKLRDDMQFFASTTRQHGIITGRKSYESIPERFRPLPDRANIVVTRNVGYKAPGAHVVGSLEEAWECASSLGCSEVFVIGGGQIYAQALASGKVHCQWVTRVEARPEGDTFYPLEPLNPGGGWIGECLKSFPADARNDHAFSIWRYELEPSDDS